MDSRESFKMKRLFALLYMLVLAPVAMSTAQADEAIPSIEKRFAPVSPDAGPAAMKFRISKSMLVR